MLLVCTRYGLQLPCLCDVYTDMGLYIIGFMFSTALALSLVDHSAAVAAVGAPESAKFELSPCGL